MSDPSSRSPANDPDDIRAAGRPGSEDAPSKGTVVELSSKTSNAEVDVDRSQELSFTAGFRRAMLALGGKDDGAARPLRGIPLPPRAQGIVIPAESVIIRDPRHDPTVPGLRRRKGPNAAASAALYSGPDVSTPVEPSRARWRERNNRRVGLTLSFAALGAVVGLLFAHWSSDPLPDAQRAGVSDAAPGSVPAIAPARPSQRRAASRDTVSPTSGGVPPRAALSASSNAPAAESELKNRQGAKRPAPSRDGMWFPPE